MALGEGSNEDDVIKYQIEIHAYDVSRGDHVDGAWVTGVVAYGREYIYGSAGVESCRPCETVLGEPSRTEVIGHTEVSYSLFLDYVLALGETNYRPTCFCLGKHDSISFCGEVSGFLCGINLPKYLNFPSAEEFSLDKEVEDLLLHRVSLTQGQGGISFGVNSIGERLKPEKNSPSPPRSPSPDIDELQAQIEALRANQKALKERREQQLLQEDEYDDLPEFDKSSPPRINGNSGSSPTEGKKKVVSFCDSPTEIVDIKRQISTTSSEEDSSAQIPPLEEVSSLPLCPIVQVNGLEPGNEDVCGPAAEPAIFQIRNSVSPVFLTESEEDDSRFDQNLSSCLTYSPEEGAKESSSCSTLCEWTDNLESSPPMADNEGAVGGAGALPPEEAQAGEASERKSKNQKPAEPPVTFREFDHTADFEDLVRTIVTLLDPEEQDRLREMEDWIIKNEGTWVLSESFNNFLGRVLHDPHLPSDGRVSMLRLLAYGAGNDDVVLILHSDRKEHLVMNYCQQFDRLPIKEQEACALFIANLFETNSSSEWLLYISEWQSNGLDLSNIRVTTKVAVNALLGDTPTLQDYGSAIMHNLGTREVFDDICTELAMAILQFFNGKPPEEQVFRCLKALHKFACISHREVPQLIKMIGPEPSKFNGLSARCDEFIQKLNDKLARVALF